MVNSNSAAEIDCNMLPAVGEVSPCVDRSFLAAVRLVILVFIPIPLACSLMVLLVDSSGLSAVVLRLGRVIELSIVWLVGMVAGGMASCFDVW